jgi:hypothetical protein
MRKGWVRVVTTAGLAIGFLATLGAVPARAQGVDFGVRAGGYLDHQDPFVGLEVLSRLGSSDWYANPNVEFIFADTRDRVSLNFDFHYDFLVTKDYYLWAGGGPAVIHIDSDRGHSAETNGGVNLLGGIGWRLQGFTPYAQLKIVLSNDSSVAAGVGIRF